MPVSDPFSIFLAKLIANTLFLLRHRNAYASAFRRSCTTFPSCPCFTSSLLVFFLGSLGISIAGTALSAISAQARMRELSAAFALLPLLTPVLVASTEVTKSLFDRSPYVQWKGVGFLAVFDLVFLTALWLFGEYLLEE